MRAMLLFAGLWATCASGAALASETIAVPLTLLKTCHAVVPVTINGKGPFRLVLDTGSPVTFVSNQVARRAGLITEKTARTPALMGLRGMVSAKNFAVGNVNLPDFSLLVLDHPIIGLIAQVDGPVDGIVGFTFFARFRTVIDYAAGQVTFTPVAYQPADVVQVLTARLMQRGPAVRVQRSAALWGLRVEKEKSDEAEGVRVSRIYRGSAAEEAGLRIGDRILSIDGRWTDSVPEAYEVLAQVKPGQEVAVEILRAGQVLSVRVRPRAGF
ncbi:MAG: aspartyl protease family protein [Chloroherpetonaceae bacterium]|nr:aspartyl protease family protein [Chthonomonadaceae bacterium]MDW8208738.1 aspartyl protease family protein [Chloroherpetonaceae bacterium]